MLSCRFQSSDLRDGWRLAGRCAASGKSCAPAACCPSSAAATPSGAASSAASPAPSCTGLSRDSATAVGVEVSSSPEHKTFPMLSGISWVTLLAVSGCTLKGPSVTGASRHSKRCMCRCAV